MTDAPSSTDLGRSGVHTLVLRLTPFVGLVALATSALLLALRHADHGRIALPPATADVVVPSAEGDAAVVEEDEAEHDPFDQIDPEVWEDGVPLADDAFWRRTRLLGRLPLLGLSLGVLAVRLATFLVPVVSGWNTPSGLPLLADLVALGLYIWLAALAVSSLPLRDVPTHWRTVLHQASLLGTVSACRMLELLLPADGPNEVGQDDGTVLPTLRYAELGCLMLATAVAVSIPRGPALHFPLAKLYSPKVADSAFAAEQTLGRRANVSGESEGNIVSQLMFGYATNVVTLAGSSETLDVQDLPIVPSRLRAMPLFQRFRREYGSTQKSRSRKRGSGWTVLYKVFRANLALFITQALLASITAVLYYGPALFIQRFVAYLEQDPTRKEPRWGWIYAFGLFAVSAVNLILIGLLWSVSTTQLELRIKVQLNTLLFAKTLVRKDLASSSSGKASVDVGEKVAEPPADGAEDAEDVTSKSQVMTLMTVDVDRVSEFAMHFFTLIDAPIEIVVGFYFAYQLLGVSALVGLLATCLVSPLNHFASKFVVEAQERLMEARDERTALMNEVLQGVNMIKFMAWERSFEKRIQAIREKELRWQKRNYLIEVLFTAIWAASPAIVIVAAFTDYVWRREMALPPSIAFTAVAIFGELRFSMNALPETFISVLQGFVSLRRIEKYLSTAEIDRPVPTESRSNKIFLNSATISWPKDKVANETAAASASATPKTAFSLLDLSLNFPEDQLSLICGRLGSGKTLLLLALLGEADLLAGQLVCPRSKLDAMSNFDANATESNWLVKAVSAYVPQTAWLRNASIKENILFGLPLRPKRYQQVLDACSLTNDLRVLEDGDETEVGESGLNLSGGQKARVSLARAVYSRASIILLDDVLAAVDAHTAKHIFNRCLRGPLMEGRTVILVSHHVKLCAPGAAYVVSLDNGTVAYSGPASHFIEAGLDEQASQTDTAAVDEAEDDLIEDIAKLDEKDGLSEDTVEPAEKKAAPRKLIEDEKRATGSVNRDVWLMYLRACGGWAFWLSLGLVLVLSMFTPLLENGWLRHWSNSYVSKGVPLSALQGIGIYLLITLLGVCLEALTYFVMYRGALRASGSIHNRMLETVLRATVRFHQTESRGRLLNRFGKDMEGLDSSLPDNILRTIIYGLSVTSTFVTLCVVGGLPFIIAATLLGFLYWKTASVYGQASRDMRRLDSVTRSPLYNLYGETLGGIAVIRAFGAASTTLSSMFRAINTNVVTSYWMFTINRWLSARMNLLSSAVLGAVACALIVSGSTAATAGFALAFANSVSHNCQFVVRRWTSTVQSMVAVERVKAYSELPLEAAEFVEPRPPASWPTSGQIDVEDLEIKYAPELPTVLHKVSFSVEAGTRVAIVGSTGSGKSTLALALLRLVEAHSGRILVDGIDIAKIGLTDLRQRALTIIPQDPTILSGTLRSTLDVFGDYEGSDGEIFEALRRVHLLPRDEAGSSRSASSDAIEEANANVFRDLDSKVSESGDNFSQGEKQLICFARALLKKSKILLLDEATASIDNHTDELVQQTLREEFPGSTLVTIAHRLQTIIDYDIVIVLAEGRLLEHESPWTLLQDPTSAFHALCEATGPVEFEVLKRAAETASTARP